MRKFKSLVSMMERNYSQLIWINLLVLFLMIISPACRTAPQTMTADLVLESHLLQSPPDPDTKTFLPIDSTQEQVLEKHQAERERTVINQIYQASGDINPRTDAIGSGRVLTAVMISSADEPFRQTIHVLQGEEAIYSVDAGLPSPALPLQGLWSYADHWILEILYTDQDIWQGRIYQDGELLNQTLNYQDAFGFQLLAGKPFYFFQRSGGLGYSYDGEEHSLPYEVILHYGCCSAAALNPVPAENMVAFFAFTGDDWFYVELGTY